jgi:hypothetical protein
MAATLETSRFRNLDDVQILHGRRSSGLGLGIRAAHLDLHPGEPLQLHLVYGNISSTLPIAATGCQGFSLSQEDERGSQPITEQLVINCSPQNMLSENNLLLQQGQIKMADINTAGTSLHFDHPGRYLIEAHWQSLSPGDVVILPESGLPPNESNMIVVTVH